MAAEKEEKIISKLLPEFAVKVRKFLNAARTAGLTNITLFSGYRSVEEQQAIFNKRDGSTNARGGFSWHNYGMAVDVVFIDTKGNPSWGAKWPWQKLGEIGESVGLEWGGRFKSIKDLGHFQWPTKHGLKFAQMFKAYSAGGVSAAWKLVRDTEGAKNGSTNNESVSRIADNERDELVGNGASRRRRRDQRGIRPEQEELA